MSTLAPWLLVARRLAAAAEAAMHTGDHVAALGLSIFAAQTLYIAKQLERARSILEARSSG